jgi:hypothetical protein
MKKPFVRTLPHYLRYYFWTEFDRQLVREFNFVELKKQSKKATLIKLIEMVQKWRIDRRYIIYNSNNVAIKVKFGLIRWFVEQKWKINVGTNQPIHKHLSPLPEQMLIGFLTNKKVNDKNSPFQFIRENDWIDLENDVIFFKRIDYSFLLKVVIVDERTKRRKRFLTTHSFQSPLQAILTMKPPELIIEDQSLKSKKQLTLESWPSTRELHEIKIILLQSEMLSPHQFIHPSEKILNISNDEISSWLSMEKTNQLFSFDWFTHLPITFQDDWALLRDTCDSLIQEIKDEVMITEDVTGDVVDQESNLLPDVLDAYAMYAFKPRPHGLLRREWKPLKTTEAIELIKTTIPEKTSLVSAGEQIYYKPPNQYFYEGGRLYKILTL